MRGDEGDHLGIWEFSWWLCIEKSRPGKEEEEEKETDFTVKSDNPFLKGGESISIVVNRGPNVCGHLMITMTN